MARRIPAPASGRGGRVRLTDAAAPLMKRKTSPFWRFRPTLLIVTVAWFAQRYLQPILLPYGPAVQRHERMTFSSVDYSNDSLQAKHGKLQKIYERVLPGEKPLLNGPETVLFDANGVLHVMTEDAKLVTLTDFAPAADRVTVMATAREVAYLGIGRPLGGCFHPIDGSLYFADAHLGLMRLPPPPPPPQANGVDDNSINNSSMNRKVELIASRVLDEETGVWSPLRFVDDVVVGPKTGRVYFTDATDILADRVGTSTKWDVLYTSKMDLCRGKRTGRLLMYDPLTDQVSILARNLSFANGVSVDQEETFVLFAETVEVRLKVLDLASGQLRAIDGKALPGYPDGVDCARTTSGTCYAAIVSAVVPIHRILNVLPDAVDRLLRTVLLMLPRFMAPPVQPYGGVAEVNVTSGTIRRIIQDPTAKDIGMLTGVTVHDNKLYLGSLENNFIGVYHLHANE